MARKPKSKKKNKPKNRAAQALVKRRWDKMTEEQKSRHGRRLARARWAA